MLVILKLLFVVLNYSSPFGTQCELYGPFTPYLELSTFRYERYCWKLFDMYRYSVKMAKIILLNLYFLYVSYFDKELSVEIPTQIYLLQFIRFSTF